MSFLRSQPLRRALLVVALLALVWVVVGPALSGGDDELPTALPTVVTTVAATQTTPAVTSALPATDPASGLAWIAVEDLPRQAHETLRLIRSDGPFPYPRNDDQTFLNREGLLPKQARGYYKEYTVVTPGSDDRGARRIVTGAAGETYWTDDHYRSFARIREGT